MKLISVGRSPIGRGIRLIGLSFTALPAAPTDVIISEVAATSVRLEWSYKGSEDLQYYVIQYKPKNANQVSEIRLACIHPL